MSKESPKVFVGMSGGVDSSVTAALLKERGFDVYGVFIKVWEPDWYPCTWREDRRDAMRVAAQLNIPFSTLDLEKEYKQEIVDYMVEEYRQGRVPNPDVMCNKQIKFGSFLDWALKQGAGYIATGHYARIREFKDQKSKVKSFELLKGKDENKDQSYFLWTLTQKQLRHTLFPIGEFEKIRVREMAEEYDLPTAHKKDSQGLCFIGEIEMRDFLSHFIEPRKGGVLDESGNVIGEHDGAFFFAIGQRHGFSITNTDTRSKPHYVVDKNIANNTITVSEKQKQSEYAREHVVLSNENWVAEKPSPETEYTAKIRYRGTPQKARYKDGCISFAQPQNVSAGQSIVLYDGDICLGGGIISE